VKKILVVDDNEELLESLVIVLTHLGYYVCGCVSFCEAKQKLASEHFDICIIDVVYKGEGVADVYSLPQRYPETKFIVITAYSRILNKEALHGQGVPVLSKPFSLEELMGVVTTSERYN